MSVNKLYEFIDHDRAGLEVLTEEGRNGKSLCLQGTFIQAEVVNQNKRKYPLSEISRAVGAINEKIRKGQSVLGELDHPEELTINLDRVSHVITDMFMDGKNGCGKLRIIETTPMGQIAKGLLEANVRLGVSSRGSGNVGMDGTVSDYEIVTVDIVAQPSAPDAYPESIYESLYNMRGGEAIHRVATAASLNEHRAKKHLDKAIVKFIKDLKLN